MIDERGLFEDLNAVFSVVMLLDRDLRIVKSSHTLQKFLPHIADSPVLNEIFSMKRPAAVSSFDDLRQHTDHLILMVANDESFAVRGQFFDPVNSEHDHLFFLGSPWLTWAHSNCPDIRIGLGDFAPGDAQMDQLFYISTERQMIQDLGDLNQRLASTSIQLQATQQEKSDLFAKISHEMRTPLSGLISAMTLLADEELTGRATTLLDLASKSATNLLEVVHYVLDISKIEHADLTPNSKPFEVSDLMSSVIAVVQAKALEKGLEIRSQIDDRLPSTYMGDASIIQQALLNLVINAIKFTDGGQVNLRATMATENDMTLRIEVSDTGIGIAEQDLSQIFQPFYRAQDTSTSNRDASTGLGLNICERNIKFLGGHIGVISERGEGSTFWLELPCPASSSVPAAPSNPVRENAAHIMFQGSRVLLVDDSSINLTLGKMILESMGVEAIIAASGEEAVKLAAEEKVDIVLMDINMPGIDGYEATRRIREFRNAGELPIVALSAFASPAERRLAEDSGMNGFQTKPIERYELAKVLNTWLKAKPHALSSKIEPTVDAPFNPVDHAVLENLVSQIGYANLHTVMNKFFNELEGRWQAIENARNNDDLSREAHTLASTCSSFGLPSVAEKLACIERQARFGDADDPPSIAETGQELKLGAKALMSALEEYRTQP